MAYETVLYDVADRVATITLNRPEKLNAVNGVLVRELMAALEAADADDGVRAVIVTGAGRAFCAGADLSRGEDSFKAPGSDPEEPGGKVDLGDKAYQELGGHLAMVLYNLKKPVIAAINGAAAGVGCSLALMGDIIVAGESAYFLQAFRRIGLVPDGGSTYLLPRLIGKARALEMALLGEKIPAKTALDWGLVNRVVPDDQLMTTAHEIARSLADGPWALGSIRKLIWDSLDNDWLQQLHAERVAQKTAGRTADFREGVMAFLQKRVAVFTRK